MNRDMDLCRDIMIAIEKSRDDEPASIHLNNQGQSELQLSKHVRLLAEAGLIHAFEARHLEHPVWQPHALTWEGYEFLDLIRNEAAWRHVRQIAVRSGGLNSTIVKEVALREARKAVGHDHAHADGRVHFSEVTPLSPSPAT